MGTSSRKLPGRHTEQWHCADINAARREQGRAIPQAFVDEMGALNQRRIAKISRQIVAANAEYRFWGIGRRPILTLRSDLQKRRFGQLICNHGFNGLPRSMPIG